MLSLGYSATAQLIQDLHTIYEPILNGTEELDTTLVYSPLGIIKPGVNYHLTLGTGYSALGKGMGVGNAYIAPTISYSPNKKLQLVGGLSIARNHLNGMSWATADDTHAQQPPIGKKPLQIWAFAQYNFNNRLSVYAMGKINNNQPYISLYSNTLNQYNSQQFGIGLNYQINKRANVNVQFNFANSNNPLDTYRRGLFNNNFNSDFHSNFQANPFFY